MKGATIKVQIDFLAGEYGGTGKAHRTQAVHSGRARKARGCDLAFTLFQDVAIHGELPEGGLDQTMVRVSSVVAFLAMKGMALHDRLKEKDAWDIYFTLTNFPGGLDSLAAEIAPHVDQALVREGLNKIGQKFATIEHAGPKFVADFEDVDDPESRAVLIRDAFEKVDYLLRKLGIR
ncbi:MAG: nucleotidyl transferase AbiEii/AbiGii toxin family protein [Bryobacteraceae bacterium]